MKQIGYVEPSLTLTDDGYTVNPKYAGGSIVILSEREIKTLIMLQDAWDDGIFLWHPVSERPDDREMSDIFKAILSFVEMKFSINEFRHAIDKLGGLLKNEAENEKLGP